MRKIILILIVLTLNNCGFSPVYNDTNNNIKIVIGKIDGDTNLNNILKTKLSRYNFDKSEKTFYVDATTLYSKNILSKDKTGRASDLKLYTTINFKILYNNENYNFSFSENLNIDRLSDFTEQNNYENEIKENFVDTILDKLIFNLNSL